MHCPFCDFEETRVIDSRSVEEGNSIRRRRECLKCAKRFTTYEIIEDISLLVVKKDARQEKYDRNKIFSGMLKACEKRPISLAQIEDAVGKVEKEIRSIMEKEISSKQLGRIVADRLKELDQVAYIRFISVYHQFSDVDNFTEEINLLAANQSESDKGNINQGEK